MLIITIIFIVTKTTSDFNDLSKVLTLHYDYIKFFKLNYKLYY